jgi:hypothetical protein
MNHFITFFFNNRYIFDSDKQFILNQKYSDKSIDNWKRIISKKWLRTLHAEWQRYRDEVAAVRRKEMEERVKIKDSKKMEVKPIVDD